LRLPGDWLSFKNFQFSSCEPANPGKNAPSQHTLKKSCEPPSRDPDSTQKCPLPTREKFPRPNSTSTVEFVSRTFATGKGKSREKKDKQNVRKKNTTIFNKQINYGWASHQGPLHRGPPESTPSVLVSCCGPQLPLALPRVCGKWKAIAVDFPLFNCTPTRRRPLRITVKKNSIFWSIRRAVLQQL